MRLGPIIGGIVGAVIGATLSPPGMWAYGAYVGFTIGYGVGSMVDPLSPDSDIGKPEDEYTINTTSKGLEVSDILGISHIGGNVLWYGDRDKDKEKKDDTKYYVYYLTWWLGICKGPVDVIHAVYSDGNLVWQGYETLAANPTGSVTLNLGEGTTDVVTNTNTEILEIPAGHWWVDSGKVKILGHALNYYDTGAKTIISITAGCGSGSTDVLSWSFTSEEYGSGDRFVTLLLVDDLLAMSCSVSWGMNPPLGTSLLFLTVLYDEVKYETYAKGEEIGDMIFYFGTEDQVDIGSGDDRPTTNMRGLCWASFENCRLGTYPTAPTITFVIGKYPTFSTFDNSNNRVNTVNYNAVIV